MVDVCDALDWDHNQLPNMRFQRSRINIDGEQVVVVGWSLGRQLAMSLAWTAPERGLRPQAAILAFYAPTDYEDPWWQHPLQPNGALYKCQQYDVLDGVQDQPITNYDIVGAWEEPIADPRSIEDPRCRIILHINWKWQTLPVILNGLSSKEKASSTACRARKRLRHNRTSKIGVSFCSIRSTPSGRLVRAHTSARAHATCRLSSFMARRMTSYRGSRARVPMLGL